MDLQLGVRHNIVPCHTLPLQKRLAGCGLPVHSALLQQLSNPACSLWRLNPHPQVVSFSFPTCALPGMPGVFTWIPHYR